jgi:hypothetical protein
MRKARKVNRILDRSPLLFGLVSTDLLIPMGVCAFIAFVIPNMFGASWVISLAIFIVAIASWALLTLNGVHTFMSQFSKPPRWIRAITPHKSLLQEFKDREHERKVKEQSRKKRAKR